MQNFETDRNYDATYMAAARPRPPWSFWGAAGLLAALALLVLVGLSIPATANASASPDGVSAYAFNPRRTASSLAVVVALIGAVIGGRALAAAASRNGDVNRRRGAMVALVMGPIGLASGALVVATAKAGLGTGNGLGGGVVAMMIGLTAVAFGGLAMARSHRTG